MKYRACVTTCILILVSSSASIADPWTKSVDANLTMTQNAYSDNWIGGEAGTLSWVFYSNSLLEGQLKPTINTKNTLKLFFGQTHNQDKDTKNWEKPLKSTDRIDFETVFRLTLGGFVDPYASGRIESKFLDESDPSHAHYVNPALFTVSFGIAKVLTKVEKREWTARLGGAFRESLNRYLLDQATGTTQRETTTDGGILFVSDFKTPFADTTMMVESRLSVYKAFYYSESEKIEGQYNMDYWKSPDVDWETMFTANITKYLMVNLFVQFLYDKEVDLTGRFKQSLSLGITYKLM